MTRGFVSPADQPSPPAEGSSVAVVIPVYNTERYLAQCLSSVRNQSYANLAIIVVDDGSTDGSLRVASEFAESDPRVVIIQKRNGGIGEARNVAMDYVFGQLPVQAANPGRPQAATGRLATLDEYLVPDHPSIMRVLTRANPRPRKPRFIQFVDSDDWIERDAIEVVVRLADADNLDAVCFRMALTDESGFGLATSEMLIDYAAVPNRVIRGEEIFLYLRQPWFAWVCGGLVRTTLLTDHRLKFLEGVIHEEHAWGTLLLAAAGRVRVLADEFYHYRQRRGSVVDPIGEYEEHVVADYQSRWAGVNAMTGSKATFLAHHAHSHLLTALEFDRRLDALASTPIAAAFVRRAISEIYLPIVFGDLRRLGWRRSPPAVIDGLVSLTNHLVWTKRAELFCLRGYVAIAR